MKGSQHVLLLHTQRYSLWLRQLVLHLQLLLLWTTLVPRECPWGARGIECLGFCLCRVSARVARVVSSAPP